MELAKVDEIVDRNGADPSTLIGILQDVQEEYNYLPKDALKRLARRLEVPLSRIYGVASFYKAFSLTPRGRHLIQVCLGTACHVRGGDKILEQIQRLLNVKPGETTSDQQFSLEVVHCVGACALGPVAVVDGEYHGRMTVGKVKPMLKAYKNSGG